VDNQHKLLPKDHEPGRKNEGVWGGESSNSKCWAQDVMTAGLNGVAEKGEAGDSFRSGGWQINQEWGRKEVKKSSKVKGILKEQ